MNAVLHPYWGNGVCAECGEPALGQMKRCLPCNTEAMRARARKATRGWRQRNAAKHKADLAKWRAANPERMREHRRRWIVRNPTPRAIVRPALVPDRMTHEICATFGLNSLVPRYIVGRDDIVQEIMLAILEGRASVEQIKAQGIRQFITQFRRGAFEASGYALSLDAPMLDGGNWHDRLAA
jgi:hypothetical protein